MRAFVGMKHLAASLLSLCAACGGRDFTIVNASTYPDAFAQAIIDSVKLHAAPDLVLDGYTLHMRATSDTLDCDGNEGGCVRYGSLDIEVPFDASAETPWSAPSPEAWMIQTMCHELGHAYMMQTTGDGGMRTAADGTSYHETTGAYGTWFDFPAPACAVTIEEFGGWGEPDLSRAPVCDAHGCHAR